ncbi:MAG: hypothetical protein IPF94_10820 [Betaproteobacteria bacterium]|nr:hypothetical protein [Betaproteobacteria bacterium]
MQIKVMNSTSAKRLTRCLIAIGAVHLSVSVHSQSVPSKNSADPCHSSGEFASNVALARLMGHPLAKVISDLQSRQVLDKQIKDLIIEIYKEKLQPDDAYMKYLKKCPLGRK